MQKYTIKEAKVQNIIAMKIASLFSPHEWYNSSSTYILSFKLVALFCDCTTCFVSDLVINPNCWFSHPQVHIDASNCLLSLFSILKVKVFL